MGSYNLSEKGPGTESLLPPEAAQPTFPRDDRKVFML